MLAKANRSKADQDPAQRLPPFAGDRCTYVSDWVATRLRRQLARDQADKVSLETELAFCPNAPLQVTFARGMPRYRRRAGSGRSRQVFDPRSTA
ncbi:hypothetical protein ABZS88_44845 [Streptomyces sp. NPDC005480]|uniref:hypothetical protein n=1 Tax=Streptomyces sp. NPDC005480 TaxID=3154880 RepID=UPI0033B1273B